MDNQVNNTFNPVGLVGGVKKEGISDEKINEISNNFVDIKDQLNRIEDLMISINDNFNKRVETIKLESVMPTPVNTSEEQVEQPKVVPVESTEENDLDKTEDLSGVLENVDVMSEPQTAENVPETNTIDLSAPVEFPNPIKDEVTSNIESTVELANSEVNEPVVETTSVDDSIIPINLEELVKADTEPNFVQPEVSQIQENVDVADNNISDSIVTEDIQSNVEQIQEQPVQQQLVESAVEPAQAVQTPAPATTAAPEVQVAQEMPQLVQPAGEPAQAVQTPAPATTAAPEMQVAQEMPQLVQPVVKPAQAVQTPAPVTTPTPEVQAAQEQPVQPQLAGPTQVPTVQSETQNIQDEINNIEVVNIGVTNATAESAQQRSEYVTLEQQQALKALMMSVAAKIFTNKMFNQG